MNSVYLTGKRKWGRKDNDSTLSTLRRKNNMGMWKTKFKSKYESKFNTHFRNGKSIFWSTYLKIN